MNKKKTFRDRAVAALKWLWNTVTFPFALVVRATERIIMGQRGVEAAERHQAGADRAKEDQIEKEKLSEFISDSIKKQLATPERDDEFSLIKTAVMFPADVGKKEALYGVQLETTNGEQHTLYFNKQLEMFDDPSCDYAVKCAVAQLVANANAGLWKEQGDNEISAFDNSEAYDDFAPPEMDTPPHESREPSAPIITEQQVADLFGETKQPIVYTGADNKERTITNYGSQDESRFALSVQSETSLIFIEQDKETGVLALCGGGAFENGHLSGEARKAIEAINDIIRTDAYNNQSFASHPQEMNGTQRNGDFIGYIGTKIRQDISSDTNVQKAYIYGNCAFYSETEQPEHGTKIEATVVPTDEEIYKSVEAHTVTDGRDSASLELALAKAYYETVFAEINTSEEPTTAVTIWDIGSRSILQVPNGSSCFNYAFSDMENTPLYCPPAARIEVDDKTLIRVIEPRLLLEGDGLWLMEGGTDRDTLISTVLASAINDIKQGVIAIYAVDNHIFETKQTAENQYDFVIRKVGQETPMLSLPITDNDIIMKVSAIWKDAQPLAGKEGTEMPAGKENNDPVQQGADEHDFDNSREG